MPLEPHRDASEALSPTVYLHPRKQSGSERTEMVLIGPGQVGSALLRQLGALQRAGQQAPTLVGILRRSGLCHQAAGIDPDTWLKAPSVTPLQSDAGTIARLFDKASGQQKIIIDASAEPSLADHYEQWLGAGINVVTASKLAGSGCFKRYRDIRQSGQGRWYYETTVGAALPVISTLRQLIATGDEIISVRGLLSGSLSWLLKRFQQPSGTPLSFSELIEKAGHKGLTEPDPLEDLSGQDVIRKAIILAREIGMDTDAAEAISRPVADLPPQSAYPFDRDTAAALNRQLTENAAKAAANGRQLVYLADISVRHGIRIGLQEVAATSPFATARACDNVIEIRSRRYLDNPLVIQGPGAGPEVTASGLLAEILQIHHRLKPVAGIQGLNLCSDAAAN